jgi:hypothetical protein
MVLSKKVYFQFSASKNLYHAIIRVGKTRGGKTKVKAGDKYHTIFMKCDGLMVLISLLFFIVQR